MENSNGLIGVITVCSNFADLLEKLRVVKSSNDGFSGLFHYSDAYRLYKKCEQVSIEKSSLTENSRGEMGPTRGTST